MNDRFRFRVWDLNNKCWIERFNITSNGNAWIWNEQVPDWDSDNLTKEIGPHIIVQCTGLKDRNGKLIYEGDIIEFYTKGTPICKVSVEVGFSKNIYGIYPFADPLYQIHPEAVEVIGTRFEHSELLK